MNVFGKGLTTLDSSLYDENQILRIPNTKHEKSGLYKIQLSVGQLTGLDINFITCWNLWLSLF
jgi:hypothetical protein